MSARLLPPVTQVGDGPELDARGRLIRCQLRAGYGTHRGLHLVGSARYFWHNLHRDDMTEERIGLAPDRDRGDVRNLQKRALDVGRQDLVPAYIYDVGGAPQYAHPVPVD